MATWQEVANQFFGGSDITQAQGVNGEPGVDIGLPAGQIIRTPAAGRYVAALSTPNETVIQTAQGWLLDFMHIDPVSYQNGQVIARNAEVGTVTTKDEPGGSYGGKTYDSTGPHLEFGVYSPGSVVGQDYHPGYDPTAYLASLADNPTTASAGSNQTGAATNPLGIGPGGWTDPGSYVSGNVPNVQSAINGAIHPVEAFIARFGLAALFAIAALGVGAILIVRLSESGGNQNVRIIPV